MYNICEDKVGHWEDRIKQKYREMHQKVKEEVAKAKQMM